MKLLTAVILCGMFTESVRYFFLNPKSIHLLKAFITRVFFIQPIICSKTNHLRLNKTIFTFHFHFKRIVSRQRIYIKTSHFSGYCQNRFIILTLHIEYFHQLSNNSRNSSFGLHFQEILSPK